MNEPKPIRVKVELEVKSAAPVEGHYGPQAQLEVVWPWSKVPAKAWIPLKGNEEILAGVYPCIVERGKLKVPQDGGSYDGSREWQFYWKIVEFNVTERGDEDYELITPKDNRSVAKSISPTPTSSWDKDNRSREEETRRSIERQTSLKGAIEVMTSRIETGELIQNSEILDLATVFYMWLSDKNITGEL